MVGELTDNNTTRSGITAAATAYGLWGLAPLFWPLLGAAGAIEVLAHRFIWSVAFAAALAAILGIAWWRVLRDRRTVATLAIASALVGINWGLFIWAVNNGHALDAALGYYINPLFSVLAGVLLLGERLSVIRWIAVGVAAAGVTWMTIDLGQVPWIALTLAGTFAIYGVIKKRIQVEPVTTMAVEALLLSPVALGYLIVLAAMGTGSFIVGGWGMSLLLIATGAVSLSPLLLFSIAARKIPLFTLGMLQYIAPTMHLILGIYVLGEPMSQGRLIGFIAVWCALGLITIEGLRVFRQRQQQRNETATSIVDEATTSPEENDVRHS